MSLKTKGIDHIAIAVKDLVKSSAIYRDILGLGEPEYEEVPDQQVRTAIFGHGMGRVELISPTVTNSGLARFIEKRGEGLHHLCLEVEDIHATMKALEQQGAPLIDKVPKRGAGGALIAFVHPKATGGVLIELRQASP